jgi:integrase
LTPTAAKWLREVIRTRRNVDPSEFIFFADERRLLQRNPNADVRHTPLSRGPILHTLYKAFGRIGIDKAERERRRLTFHTWRHWFISTMRNYAVVPDPVLFHIVGHSDGSALRSGQKSGVTGRYTQADHVSRKPIVAFLENVLHGLPSNKGN